MVRTWYTHGANLCHYSWTRTTWTLIITDTVASSSLRGNVCSWLNFVWFLVRWIDFVPLWHTTQGKKTQKHSFAAHSRYCLWHSDIFCLLTLLIPPLWEAKVLLRVKVAHQKRVGYIFVVGISFFLFFFFEGVKKIIDHSKQCLRDKHTSLVEAFSEPGITGLENASVFIKGNAVSTDQQALHPSARNCSK